LRQHAVPNSYANQDLALFFILLIKTKFRNRMNAQAGMRVAISNIVPARFEKLLSKKQEQKSH